MEIAGSTFPRVSLGLAVRVFENDKLVLLLVVAVFLVRRVYRQSNVVLLDDLGHELVVVGRVAAIFSIVEIEGMLDVARRDLPDRDHIGVALQRDRILGGNFAAGDLRALLQLGL